MGKRNTDLRSVDGQTIYLPPEIGGTAGEGNLALPNVYSESATQLYPIGTKFVSGERVFHYAYNGSTNALPTLRGIVGYDAVEQQSQASYGTSQAAGLGTVASPFQIDGESDGVPVANAWAGMYILILTTDAVGGRVTMRIVSHTKARTASPYTIDCVLDQPLPHAVAADTNCDIIPSRYADVRPATDLTAGMYPVLGVALIYVTTLYYFWLQTWGPCFITTNITQPGDVAYDRTVVFSSSDGTIEPCDHAWGTSTTTSAQFAGCTLATNGSESEWIMLMLDR